MHELHLKCITILCIDAASIKWIWGCIEELIQWAYKSKFRELDTDVPRHICRCDLRAMWPVNEACISHLVALIHTVIFENRELVHAMFSEYINPLEKVENLWRLKARLIVMHRIAVLCFNIHNVLQMLVCPNAFHVCYGASRSQAFITFLSAAKSQA